MGYRLKRFMDYKMCFLAQFLFVDFLLKWIDFSDVMSKYFLSPPPLQVREILDSSCHLNPSPPSSFSSHPQLQSEVGFRTLSIGDYRPRVNLIPETILRLLFHQRIDKEII